MPPLNRLLEGQENNLWRYQASQQNETSRGSYTALSESPLKVTVGPTLASPIVRFSTEVTSFSTICRGDYSDQEIENCWYTASEYASFRQDVCNCVYLCKIEPSRIDEVEYTMRGVEHRTEEGAIRRYTLRSRGKSSVLDEQDFQDGIGESSVQAIADIYSRAASDAVYDALNFAAMDQLEAERHQHEVISEEIFSDDWISSISTAELDAPACEVFEGDMGFLEEVSGFDDAWLRDIAVEA